MMESAHIQDASLQSEIMEQDLPYAKGQPLVVTVAGEYGAGTQEVAVAMADRLGLLCYDTPLIDRMIQDSMTSMEHAGRSPAATPKHDWLHKLKAGPGKEGSFSLHMVRTIMGIGAGGGVIIGNGAHLILFGLPLFRIKVEAGKDFCARRVVEQEGISFADAKKKVERMNRQHLRRVREVFEQFPNDRTYYDLVLSAERFRIQEMVEIALEALEESGLHQHAASPLH